MEYKVCEIALKSRMPFLTNVLIALFGAFCEELKPPPVCNEIEAVCNSMASQNFRLVSQFVKTGWIGRSEAIILIFVRKGEAD